MTPGHTRSQLPVFMTVNKQRQDARPVVGEVESEQGAHSPGDTLAPGPHRTGCFVRMRRICGAQLWS